MKQVYKGEMLTLNKVVSNILEVFNRAESVFANDWYKEAHDYASYLSVMHNVPLTSVCGIIAAFSPVKRWEENKMVASVFLATGRVKHTTLFANKAKDILASDGDITTISEILNGRKITAFFLNILNPDCSNALTIDRHALSIGLGYSVTDSQYRGMTASQYEFFVLAYNIAAKKAKISPILMQSTTWQQWRAEKGIIEQITEHDSVPF